MLNKHKSIFFSYALKNNKIWKIGIIIKYRHVPVYLYVTIF